MSHSKCLELEFNANIPKHEFGFYNQDKQEQVYEIEERLIIIHD